LTIQGEDSGRGLGWKGAIYSLAVQQLPSKGIDQVLKPSSKRGVGVVRGKKLFHRGIREGKLRDFSEFFAGEASSD